MPSGAACPRLKAEKEENLTKYAGSIYICKERRKNVNSDDEKSGD